MKDTWKKVAVAAVALAGTAGVSNAASLDGPTGLFLNPTAGVAEKSTADVGVDYLQYSNSGVRLNRIGVSGAFGVADKVEVSGGYHRYSKDARYNEWGVGAKYQFLNRPEKGLSVAAGANYLKTTNGGGHSTDVYVVATQAFSNSADRAPIAGNLGVRYNDYSGGSGGDKVDVFAGVVVPITRTGELSLIGELGSKRHTWGESEYALGLHYRPAGASYNVSAGIARHIKVVQVGYVFGK